MILRIKSRDVGDGESLQRNRKLVTDGFPTVNVPVLSKITDVTFCAFSNASDPLIRIPFNAPKKLITLKVNIRLID